MRFTKFSIDGFGRFNNTDLDISPRLHIISGPNERGKSTLRHFISDMLYGQKRSSTRRLYEDSNELRAPWEGNGSYGGRMIYRLDSGQEIEVERSFESEKEFVKLFDRTNARDITGAFEVLKNRESTFAEKHLNMAKSVFLGIATISHVSLSDLGDRQALMHIREKLLSLTDSAEEDQSAEKAMRWLRERIAVIGDAQARTRPLPTMRQRLTDLQAEHQEVYEIAREVVSYEKQRAVVLDEIGDLLNRRTELERKMASRSRAERADLVRRASALQDRVQQLERECFELSAAREFPLGRVAEVQRLATLLEGADTKLRETAARLEALVGERDEAEARLRSQGLVLMREADPEIEAKLADLDKTIGVMISRIEHLEQMAARAAAILEEAEGALQRLPDFSRFPGDPVQHFSALTGAFEQSRRALEDEQRRLEGLSQRAAEQESVLESPRRWFAGRPDLAAEIRAHEAAQRDLSALNLERERRRAMVMQHAEDLAAKFPGLAIMTVLGVVFAAALGLIAALTGNSGIYIPAAILFVMSAFFFYSSFANRRQSRQAHAQSAEFDAEEAAREVGRGAFEDLMSSAGCATLREFEASFERYREGEHTLVQIRERTAEQAKAVDDAQVRVEAAGRTLRDALDGARETLAGEEDAEAALGRVLSRYQEYREAKRRMGESREARDRSQRELETLRQKLAALRQQDVEWSLQVRQFMRENHFPDESQFDSALKALRNYRIRSAQMRQKQGELEVAQGQVTVLRREHDAALGERDRLRDEVVKELAPAGAESLEVYFAKAEQARRYQELWRERSGLADQLGAILGDHDLAQLREESGRDSAAPDEDPPEAPAEALKAELARVLEALEAKRKEDQALQLMIAEKSAGHRSLNEVDEERAATEQRVAELELELKSAGYAMSVIEEVTRERHTLIAPKLAELASGFLRKITAGVYSELLVDRGMQISVRIPQTKSMNADPQRLLSKGTVDQIYFALRLAMVQCISENSESIPMVLDDPFANYDDDRLLNAMQLLAEVGARHQVLLFTCREDVVRAAESVKAPITRL